MPVIDLGSVVGPQGPQGATGATGAQGIQGNPGPNQVTDQTSTNLNGVLFGNQSRVTVKPVDSTPTADSTNLVSSGGTDKAIKGRVPVYGLGKNLLDNAYFVGGGSQLGDGVFPINQRQQSSYSVAGYGIDRWANTRANTITLESDGLKLSYSTSQAYQQIAQAPDNPTKYNGKTLTFSALMVAVTQTTYLRYTYGSGASEHFITEIPGGTTGLVTMTFTVPSNATNAGAQLSSGITTPTSGYFKVAAMKLEFGTQQTLAHQENGAWVLNEIPDYGEELRKCQRYYFSYSIPSGTALAFNGLRGDMTAGTNMGAQIELPVVMVKTPTVDAAAHSIRGNGSVWNTGLSVTSPALSMNANHVAVEVIASNASFPGLTNGYAVLFTKLNLSAES